MGSSNCGYCGVEYCFLGDGAQAHDDDCPSRPATRDEDELQAQCDLLKAEIAQLKAENSALRADGELLDVDYGKLDTEIDLLKSQSERAWQILQSLGISKDRARTLDNAVLVFDQRLRNESTALKAEADLLKAALRWLVTEGRDGCIETPPQFAAVIAEATK